MFSLILVLAAVLSAIALTPGVRTALTKIPSLCTPFRPGGDLAPGSDALIDCDLITGFGAVYRICFGTTMTYLFFCLLMIRVRSSRDPRSKIQNGFWFFKFLLWFLLVLAAFFIPVEGFTPTWMVIGMIGGLLYILIQLILLVDFAHSWNETWVAAYEDTSEKCYELGLVMATLFFYAVALTGIGLLFHYYANDSACGANKAILSLNLIFCVIVSVISILPRIREGLPSSGILQSSIVSCYVVYLTWSGMTNGKDPLCNPTLPSNTTVPDAETLPTFDWQVAIGLLLLVLSVLYSSIRSSSHTAVGRMTISGAEKTTLPDSGPGLSSSEGNKQTVWDDEEDGVTYNYSMFHFMLMLATLYVMVMLTNWLKPQNDLKSLKMSWGSYWVRISSTWACLSLYLWTMIAPLLFPDREFF